jgi:hypothetical protein
MKTVSTRRPPAPPPTPLPADEDLLATAPEDEGWERPDVGGQQPPIEYRKVSLGDLGHLMPIGMEDGAQGKTQRGFAFREWTGVEDEEIDKVRQSPDLKKFLDHNGKTVSIVLAVMLDHWGKFGAAEWNAMKVAKRILVLEESWMADVLTAWLALRVHAMGSRVVAQLECPRCHNEWAWPADLDKLDIQVADSVPRFTYRTPRPIQSAGKSYEMLCVQPARWRAVSTLSTSAMSGSIYGIKQAMTASCLYGLLSDDESLPVAPITQGTIRAMPKRLSETLTRFIGEQFPEPDTALAPVCPSCKHGWEIGLRWTYDFFFGAASL